MKHAVKIRVCIMILGMKYIKTPPHELPDVVIPLKFFLIKNCCNKSVKNIYFVLQFRKLLSSFDKTVI